MSNHALIDSAHHRWELRENDGGPLYVRCLDCGLERPSEWWFDNKHLPGLMPSDEGERVRVRETLIEEGFARTEASLRTRATPIPTEDVLADRRRPTCPVASGAMLGLLIGISIILSWTLVEAVRMITPGAGTVVVLTAGLVGTLYGLWDRYHR